LRLSAPETGIAQSIETSALSFLSDFQTPLDGNDRQSSLNILSSDERDATRAEPFPGCLHELPECLIAGIAK
jgi:hypothetical protein